MKTRELLQTLIQASEKGARIARLIRSEQSLFDLLVEEKTGTSKNERFIQDFKTLADVLVQEVATYDLKQKFPGLIKNIRGEESNTFTNTLGETITVELKDDPSVTAQLLSHVLNGNLEAANLLAKAAHEQVALTESLESVEGELDEDEVGIWIDPIDSTAQYIEGNESVIVDAAMYAVGLQCVVVLMGAFHLKSGKPIAGVLNQPFFKQESDVWSGRSCWGISAPPVNRSSPLQPTPCPAPIVMSSSEDPALKEKLLSHYSLQFVAGAGYKILCVIDGQASAYLLTKGSTFKWDTCGPHAVLRSMGGGIVNLKDARRNISNDLSYDEALVVLEKNQLSYSNPDDAHAKENVLWANSGGLLAYTNPRVAIDILHKLC